MKRSGFALGALVALSFGALSLGGCAGDADPRIDDGVEPGMGPLATPAPLVIASDAGARVPRTLPMQARTFVAVDPIPPICAECPPPPAGPRAR